MPSEISLGPDEQGMPEVVRPTRRRIRWREASALPLLFCLATPALAAPDRFAAGKPLFDKYCSGCHDIGVDARNGEGPKLNGIIGRPAGTIRDYDYSSANRRSAVVWTVTNFENFIADPQADMPGTRMAVPGVGDADERAAIAAYVAGFASNGALKDAR